MGTHVQLDGCENYRKMLQNPLRTSTGSLREECPDFIVRTAPGQAHESTSGFVSTFT